MSSPAAESQSLVTACPLQESLKLPILKQSRLRGSGVSKHMRDPSMSQWKLPEKYGESLLQYPTPTSMAFMTPGELERGKRKGPSKSEEARSGSTGSSEFSSEQSCSSASENGDVRFDYTKVERQGRRLAMQAVVYAVHRMHKRLNLPIEISDDVDIALVDIRGLPTKEGLRQALIARAGSLRRAYKVFDSKNSGHVSFAKFQQGLSHLGIDTVNLLGKDAREVFQEFDDDNSGDLSLIELIGFYSEADEELLRITSDGFLPGKLLWTRYINQVNAQKTTLNRQPCWDPRRLKISQIEQLLEAYKKQREFEKHTQELRRQLHESSDLDKQRLMDALNPAKQQSHDRSTSTAGNAEQEDAPSHFLDNSLHEHMQRVVNLLRDLSYRRKDLRLITADAHDVMTVKPLAPEVVQETLGRFGVPTRDQAYLRSLFEMHQNKHGILSREAFKKFTKHITLDEVVPVRQYQDWWNFMAKDKSGVDFDHVLIWYSHFILSCSCVIVDYRTALLC